MPRYFAAFAKAGCAEKGTTISGRSTPRSARARSRAESTPMRMLSVPPEVMAPPKPSGACTSPPVMETTSTSISRRLGKRKGFSAFSKR